MFVRGIAAAVIVAAIALAGCGGPGGRARVSYPSFSASADDPFSTAIGIYKPGFPHTWSASAVFTIATGISPQIDLYFSGWKEGFRTTFAKAAWLHGAYVFVKLQPNGVSLASIASGGSDAYLRSYALAVREFNHPVLISFAHEMNGNWYSWGSSDNSPAVFISAWRHVVQIFRDEGATKAIFVWTVNSTNIAVGSLHTWWPGKAWVNWVGVDGYYRQPQDNFDSVFGQAIAQIRTFSGAPVLIAETAVGDTPNRVNQIDGLFAGARADKVVGVVWFDVAMDTHLDYQNWQLEGDASAIQAFRLAGQHYLGH
jgi:mannan endo-1,4-beta-mannosidase